MRRVLVIFVATVAVAWLVQADAMAQSEAPEQEGMPSGLDEPGETGDEPAPQVDDGATEAPAVDPMAERVQQHDARAQELFTQRDYAGALAEQRQAQALIPATPRIFNMAVCEERQGHLEAAIELYRDFLAADDAPADRRGQARQSIERLTEQLAAAREEEAAAAAAAARVDASSTDAPSRTVELSPAAFWSMLGVTGAIGAATIALGAVTLVRHEEFVSLYNDDPRSPQLQEQGRALALATNIMIGVTAFAAVTTLVFGLDTNWHRRERSEGVALVPGAGSLAIVGRY